MKLVKEKDAGIKMFHFHPAFLSYLTAGRGSSSTAGSSLASCSPAVAAFLVTASLVPDVAPSPVSLTQLSRVRAFWPGAGLLFSGRFQMKNLNFPEGVFPKGSIKSKAKSKERLAVSAQRSKCPRFTAKSPGFLNFGFQKFSSWMLIQYT